VQKCLRRLRNDGYINYRKGNGQRGCYSILIHKYQPTVGALCGMRLNAFAIGSLDKPIYEQKNCGDTAETRSSNGRATVPHTVETPLLDVLDVPDVQDVQDESGAVAPSRSKVKRACQLPEGFQPKDSHRKLALKLGIDLESAFEHFCDHHTAKGNTFTNWNAALNTWLRTEVKFSKGHNNGNGNGTKAERNQDTTLAARDQVRAKFGLDHRPANVAS
jgi:hypothetical protein